jgi:succinyl-CoA synthetase beta subunit
MDLLEHQGKRLFADAGLAVPPSRVATTTAEACEAARELGLPVAVKAQVKTGGRGKAGGIRVCRTHDEVTVAADDILGMTIRDHPVAAVLVEQAVEIEREMYVAIASSRESRGPLLVFCREGGVDIEALAREDPGALVRTPIDPLLGLCDYQVRDVVAALDPDGPGGAAAAKGLGAAVRALWGLYRDRDATLVEVNPLVLTRRGETVCLDSKVTIDDNALYRQPDLQPEESADEGEARARKAGLAFVALDGDIGVLGNGAGLVMSIIDQIADAGGRAADFCDIGGGARGDVVAAALDAILADRSVSALLVSVFGGITRCDEVARGLIGVLGRAGLDAPVTVRLDGNAAAEGRAVLSDARLDGVTVAGSPEEAVRLVVTAARERNAGARFPAGGEET